MNYPLGVCRHAIANFCHFILLENVDRENKIKNRLTKPSHNGKKKYSLNIEPPDLLHCSPLEIYLRLRKRFMYCPLPRK